MAKFLKRLWRTLRWTGDREDRNNDFLPAALEIQSTPPAPLGRAILWSVVAFLMCLIAWSFIGEVDVVVSAEGRLIPAGDVRKVQSFNKGVIESLYVSEGQLVEKGQPLLELDNILTHADLNAVRQQLKANDLLLKQEQEFYLLGSNLRPKVINAIALTDSDFIEPVIDDVIVAQRYRAHISKLKTLLGELRRSQSEQIVNDASIKKLESVIPISRKRSEAFNTLLDKGLASEAEYLERKERYINQSMDLVAAKARTSQLEASISELNSKILSFYEEAMLESMTTKSELMLKRDNLLEQLTKAENIDSLQVIRAPVRGYVENMKVNTLGGVVQAGEELLEVVPADATLSAQAFLENKDIGFIEEGDSAEIKIHTFPFTDYGVINSVVHKVTQDAIENEQGVFLFKIMLDLEKSIIETGSNTYGLRPGMTITSEINIGKRKIIDYFLSPISKSVSESIRER